MELLIWHEGLGCDDEQATQDELTARILYSHCARDHPSSGGDAGVLNGGRSSPTILLQSLHFVQGLLAFVRLVRRKPSLAQEWKQEWASVALSDRKFFILEAEPGIYMALGVLPEIAIKNHSHAYKALLHDLYEMFRLFHGTIDRNLRLLFSCSACQATQNNNPEEIYTPPSSPMSLAVKLHKDGMDLLLEIQSTRKRLRKIHLAIDSRKDLNSANDSLDSGDREDDAVAALQVEQEEVEAELQSLLARSAYPRLHQRFAKFFPNLLKALDARGASSLSELQGLGYFPMDQPSFLALQSFVNSFDVELKGDRASEVGMEASALFFKGNLLWSSMETSVMHLLYKFLRLREERGMDLHRDVNQTDAEVGRQAPQDSASQTKLWMESAYEDTFLPVWSSKISYTECTATSRSLSGHLHQRRAARSLHRQVPVSLSTLMGEGPLVSRSSVSASSLSRVAVASPPTSDPGGTPPPSLSSQSRASPVPGSPANIMEALKARARSVSYRNAGILLENGYFAKPSQLLSSLTSGGSTRSEVDGVWSPVIYPLDPKETTKKSWDPFTARTQLASRRVITWYEADLTMLITVRGSPKHCCSSAVSSGLEMTLLERMESYLDGQQRFQKLAHLILTRYHETFTPRPSSPGPQSPPPFLYLNRVNLAFKVQHVPRLLKCKEGDLFPVPTRLLAYYLPTSTLALVNDLHAELQQPSSTGNRELCVRTHHAGWVLAKKSQTSRRELYVFFDVKVPSVHDLSDSLAALLQDQFGNVLF